MPTIVCISRAVCREGQIGKIVAAAVVSHQPGIMLPSALRLELYGGKDTTLIAGFETMREALDRGRPDTFIIFDTHWFTTLNHILAGAPHYKGLYLHRNERILSIGTCQVAQCHNFLDMGAAIAEGIAKTDCRVALLAAGGTSHSFEPLDTIMDHMKPDPALVVTREARAMDDKVLQCWRRGDHAAVIALYPEYRAHNPEGFFAHYLMTVGALGGAGCKAVGTQMSEYENSAGTGQIHVWFDVAA